MIAAAALFALAAARHVGYQSFRFGLIRVSDSSGWRVVALVAAVFVVRNIVGRRSPSFAWIFDGVRRELPLGEGALFDDSIGSAAVLKRLGWATLAFTALAVAMTWPQARQIHGVPDFGDPLFSIWRLAWVNHTLWRAPLHLFDANIFYPERLTLTYSDAVLVPSIMVAPLFWIGVHPVAIYNVLLLAGFALSGTTMFLFMRALTGRTDAAAAGATIFALYPFRYEHYSHLELQMTMWMPLALWGLHRTLARGRVRDGLATGAAFALQALSSLYYGCFLAVYMTVVGAVLWLGRGRPVRPFAALAAGAGLAAVLIAPVAAAYLASKPAMGDRDIGTIQAYSAVGHDYLMPATISAVYGEWGQNAEPERALFPRIAPVVLAAVAIWPPLSVVRIGYTLALIVAVDGSLGLNGATFTWLHEHVAPFRGLRVPARFSMLAGFSLALLAGFGAARIVSAARKAGPALAVAIVAVLMFEALPRINVREPWLTPPPIYGSLSPERPAVLAEFPMPHDFYRADWDARYEYFSIFHWQRLVNGNSGFFPPSYKDLLAHEVDFPSDASIDYLKRRGVQYLTYHGGLTNPVRAQATDEYLDSRRDLELVAKAPWEGGESRLYRFRE